MSRFAGPSPHPVGYLVVMLVVTASCGTRSADLTAAERSEISESVRAAVDAFAEAERRRDPEAVVSFLAPEFYMYGDGTRADYATVVEQIRSTLPTLQRFDTTWSDIEVNVLGRDLAFVSMIFRDTIIDADGATTRMQGPNTFVWQRIHRQWRILYADADHYPDASP